MKGEVPDTSHQCGPCRPDLLIFSSPFYSQEPKTQVKRLAQGGKTSRWQGQELHIGAESNRCLLPTQSLPQPSIFCCMVGIKDNPPRIRQRKSSPLFLFLPTPTQDTRSKDTQVPSRPTASVYKPQGSTYCKGIHPLTLNFHF